LFSFDIFGYFGYFGEMEKVEFWKGIFFQRLFSIFEKWTKKMSKNEKLKKIFENFVPSLHN